MNEWRELLDCGEQLSDLVFDPVGRIGWWKGGKARERVRLERLHNGSDSLRSIVWVSRGDDIADDSETVQTAAVSRHSPMNTVKRIGRLDPRFQDIVSA